MNEGSPPLSDGLLRSERRRRTLRRMELRWTAGAALATAVGVAVIVTEVSAHPRLAPVLAGGVAALLLFVVLSPRATLFALAAALPVAPHVPHSTLGLTVLAVMLTLRGDRPVSALGLRLWLLLLGWMLFVLLVIVPTLGGETEFGSVQRVLFPLAVALAATRILRDQRDVAIMGALLLLAPTVIAVVQTVRGDLVLGGRASGGFAQPSELGLAAALTFAAVWPVALRYRRWALLPVVLALIAVVLSGTRIAVLAMAAVMLVPALVARGAGGRRLRRGLVVALLLVPLTLPFAGTTLGRLTDAAQSGTAEFSEGKTGTSLGIRAVTWRQLDDAYHSGTGAQRLLGQGPGRSEQVVQTFFQGQLHLPHNEYRRIRLDFGLVGLGLFLLALAVPVVRLLRRTGSVAPALVAVSLAVLSTTDNPLFYGPSLVVPFVAVALGLRSERTPDDARELDHAAPRSRWMVAVST